MCGAALLNGTGFTCRWAIPNTTDGHAGLGGSARTRTSKRAGCRTSSRWMECCARGGGVGSRDLDFASSRYQLRRRRMARPG
jgi:hypothetical protein